MQLSVKFIILMEILKMKREIFALTITASLFLPGLQASAQAQESSDVLDACPKNAVLLTEDDNVRFIQLKIKSGQKCGMHKTAGGFAYVISGASFNLIKPDGTKTAAALKDAQTLPYPPAEHILEVTKGNLDILLLESKK